MPQIPQLAWPPVEAVRIQKSIEQDDVMMEDDDDMSFMDQYPLTYFLAPAPLLDDGESDDDTDMMDFGFDAGIEDSKRAPDIVRSVSPSSLEGLSLPTPRPPTPPRSPPGFLTPDPESATDDDDDDDEEFIRFGPGRHHTIGLPFSLKDFAALKAKKRASKGKSAAASSSSPNFLGPTSTRSRSTARFGSSPPGSRHSGGRGRTRSLSARNSPHAWREPSPDVWSIEEETEEEMNSEMGSSMAAEDLAARKKEVEETERMSEALDIPAAKPKKKVRFVLPVKE